MSTHQHSNRTIFGFAVPHPVTRTADSPSFTPVLFERPLPRLPGAALEDSAGGVTQLSAVLPAHGARSVWESAAFGALWASGLSGILAAFWI